MTLTEQALLLASWEFWSLTMLSATSAIAGFYLTFHYLRRARTIENIPTAKIRSAHQGYVELAGRAVRMEGEPILGPLTGKPCCWYRYKIERRGDKHWRTIDSGSSEHLFLLRDDTGDCIIDPDGADVTPEQTSVWYGDTRTPTSYVGSNKTDSGLFWKLAKSIGNGASTGGRYRYTEARIQDQDQIYGIGLFKTLDEVDHTQQRSEIVRELLRTWKQDKSSLLLEFDHNRNGRIDLEEWEQVRRKAQNLTQAEQQQLLDGSILHTLSDTGSGQHPFLLSSLPEFDLVRRYHLFANLAVATFFIGGAASVWLLSIKLTN